MSGRRVELHGERSELCIRFPYDERLLPVVRELPGRRFDRGERAWFCPAGAVVAVVDALHREHFAIEREVLELYRESGGTEYSGNGDAGGAVGSVTVSELNREVRSALLRAFPGDVWLVGEIAGFDKNRHRRFVHFELVEKDGEEEGADIRASVSAVLFERERAAIAAKLAAGEEPFELRDGLEVRVRVRVDLYEAKGSFQVVVEDIDPVHTLGKIARNRARILAELERLGLRDRNRLLPWPRLPLRVGLITSHGSDAYNDFLNELARSGYGFQVTVAHSPMQGQRLEQGLLAALGWFEERAADFDVVAVVRGGGGRADLLWFDSLEVAKAVASFPRKVVSGIGHQRDVSVLDLISHAEKTPTAAAAALVARVAAFEAEVEAHAAALQQRVCARLDRQRRELREQGLRAGRATRARVRGEQDRFQERRRRLLAGGRVLLREQRRRLHARSTRLSTATQGELRAGARWLSLQRGRLVARARAGLLRVRGALERLRGRCTGERLQRPLSRSSRRLEALEKRMHGLDPRQVLRRGFALVRDSEGRILRDARGVAPGQRISAELGQGSLGAVVEDVRSEGAER